MNYAKRKKIKITFATCEHCGGLGEVLHIDGAQLRAAREKQGVTLSQLAERTGLSQSHLSNMETNKIKVTDEVRCLYEKYL